MAAVLYCNGTIICNFGEKSGSLLGKNPASMGGSLASTKKNLRHMYISNTFLFLNYQIIFHE